MSWIDDLLGIHVRRGDVIYPKRRYLEVISGAIVADNPARDSTAMTFSGGGGTVGADRLFLGTSPIRINGGDSHDLTTDVTISVLDATTIAKGVLQLAGDLGGTAALPGVLKINGASVPAAPGLTVGNTLQVSATAALVYAAVNLAGGANYVVNRLPIANLAFDNPDTILTTNHAGNATQYRLLVNDNIATGADILVAKLHPGPTDGFVVTRVAGVATWAAPSTTPGSMTPGAVRQLFSTIAGPASDWVTITGDVTIPTTPGAMVVGALRGAAIGTAAPSLTPGTVLRSVTNSTIDYGAVDLANEAAVTGLLAIPHIKPHTALALLTTNGALATEWSTTIPGGLLPALAGDVTGAPGSNTAMKIHGTAVGTAGGSLTVGWSMRATAGATADWGPVDFANENAISGRMLLTHLTGAGATLNDILKFDGTNYVPSPITAVLPPSPVQLVPDMPALETLSVTALEDVCMAIVQTPPRVYHLDKLDTTSTVDGDDIVLSQGGFRWKFVRAALARAA
jgi:hypothetical protein